jgi:hypothetical protein
VDSVNTTAFSDLSTFAHVSEEFRRVSGNGVDAGRYDRCGGSADIRWFGPHRLCPSCVADEWTD